MLRNLIRKQHLLREDRDEQERMTSVIAPDTDEQVCLLIKKNTICHGCVGGGGAYPFSLYTHPPPPPPMHKPLSCGGALVHQTSWSKGETGPDNVRR